MIRFSNATPVAIAAAYLFAMPAVAQEREPVVAHVAIADLNLHSAAGVARLKERLHRAATVSCAPYGDDLLSKADAARCRSEMEQDGKLKLASLMDRNTDVQVAVAGR